MHRLLLVLAVLATACGDNRAAPSEASVPPPDDAAPATLRACLDRPSDLAVTPSGPLPCELLPPGFPP